jgi:uncharacterized OB-fold protein
VSAETDVERMRFEPPSSETGEPFWEASRSGELQLPWCRSCERPHWYPRRRCPHCRSADLEWRAAAGTGVVEAVSVQHRAGWMGLAERVPYAVAVVALDEGVSMLAELGGVDPDDPQAAVGQEVALVWEPLSDGRQLATFQVGGSQSSGG